MSSFQIGDVVTYETLDVESYSRGYGAHMETKASTIVSIRYIMANGDEIRPEKLVLVKPAESKSQEGKKD
jgi:hypothetical protein